MAQQIRAAVGMSGGVDSSAAAWLLKEQGYAVIGVTMKLFGNDDIAVQGESRCCSLDDVEDARAVARRLAIPHYVFNFGDEFHRQVMAPFAAAYERGETPNPCVECNRCLKFGAMLRRGRELDWDKAATGHYVRLEQDLGAGRWLLKRAAYRKKDQSYVLWPLNQEQLAHSLFPLGGLSKEDVRQIAAEQGFVNARKRESQDICFVPDGDYAAFIARCVGEPSPEGDFLDAEGRVLGRHKGFLRYTRGQHKGLGLVTEQPLYVQRKDPDTKAIYLGPDAALYSREATVRDCSWIAVEALTEPRRVTAKIRHSRQDCPATVEPLEGGRVRILFDEAQRACAPGQSAVFYEGDAVLGGGFLE